MVFFICGGFFVFAFTVEKCTSPRSSSRENYSSSNYGERPWDSNEVSHGGEHGETVQVPKRDDDKAGKIT